MTRKMLMLEKLITIEKRFRELENMLADPNAIADKAQYQKLAKEYSDTALMFNVLKEYKRCADQKEELSKLLQGKTDADFEALAKEELRDLEKQKNELEEKYEKLANPKEEEKNRNIIIEIRAGTGGEEASLFASDLFRMYTRFADRMGWKVDLMNTSYSDTKGFKEVTFSISGVGAEKRLKWESGAHRVQRVPVTEQSGRIHTSAATVAILIEPEEVEVVINPSDLKIDVYRSSGPGGQSVNTTDSAVRITHMPTGVVVACQDERSQLKNRAKAMRILRARIVEQRDRDNTEKMSKDRKSKIGSGDRSEKIRTYNFPDRRVTDHRIGFTSHQLESMLDGDIEELTDALIKAEMDEDQDEQR